MSNLHKKKCIACSGDMPALNDQEIDNFSSQVKGWTVIKNENNIKEIYIKVRTDIRFAGYPAEYWILKLSRYQISGCPALYLVICRISGHF